MDKNLLSADGCPKKTLHLPTAGRVVPQQIFAKGSQFPSKNPIYMITIDTHEEMIAL